MSAKRPLALLILDGWGTRQETHKNAIFHANTPVLDQLYQDYPNSLISASGMDVGLPDGQMGNSEVGHLNIGAGRIVYQELTRIGKAIDDGEFVHNPALVAAIEHAQTKQGAVHIMGLLSAGGVHSHEDHLEAMCKMALAKGLPVYLHAFLDGRDTPPRSAGNTLAKFEQLFADHGNGKIASLIGRYYAMDRDNRWERVTQAYHLITNGESQFQYHNALEALDAAYQRGETDEFVSASAIVDAQGQAVQLSSNDALIFMNFRADRARQITRTFIEPNFEEFARQRYPQAHFVMLTEYAASFNAPVAFPATDLVDTLGETLAKQGKTQLRISETEKYAHVTFFFNGGVEQAFAGESRLLINSPKVATYDLQPEMSAPELTDKLVAAIEAGEHDVIICNYPNGDMVGHTGDFEAAIKACEAVDQSIGRVVAALQKVGGEALITADHGNAEQMEDPISGQPHTAHTCELVPLIYVGRQGAMQKGGRLSDLAPTMLSLMGLTIPNEMTGKPLIQIEE